MKVILNNVSIKAISAWLPTKSIELRDFGNLYGVATVESIIKATGIERIRIADDELCSSDMCYAAASYLLDKEELDPKSIDGIVFVSQTTDWILPSTSISLQDRLGLPKETVAIDIHYGCSGYIYGIFQAALWINSGACTNVLVLAGDTTSKMINPQDKSLRMVFGDCGTATLLTKGDYNIGFNIQSDGAGGDLLIVPAGGFRMPISDSTSELVFDEDKNARSKNDLYMDGSAIFNFAINNVPSNIHDLLKLMNWNKEDISLFALHQANDFMVNYIRKKLKVSPHLVPTNVKNFGNTGPATLPLLCSDFLSRSKFDLSKVVFCGFGVGLSWGSFATSLNNTKFYPPINL